MTKQTSETYRAKIKEQAFHAARNHKITKESENVFYCGEPGTGIYSFRVCIHPGCILVYGDIGELILLPYTKDPLSWLLGCVSSTDYLISKVPFELRNNIVLKDDAYAILDEYLEEGYIDQDQYDSIVCDWDESEHDSMWSMAWHNNTQVDEIPEPFDYRFRILYIAYMLEWFVSELNKQNIQLVSSHAESQHEQA